MDSASAAAAGRRKGGHFKGRRQRGQLPPDCPHTEYREVGGSRTTWARAGSAAVKVTESRRGAGGICGGRGGWLAAAVGTWGQSGINGCCERSFWRGGVLCDCVRLYGCVDVGFGIDRNMFTGWRQTLGQTECGHIWGGGSHCGGMRAEADCVTRCQEQR